MSNQLQITGAAKIRTIQGPVVANSGVITALDGDASQYVRGDGTLADFPTSTGGGSSVSYYLNTSVSQGTIGGVAYKQLSKVPISGAGTDVTISANGYIANYITDANDPALLEVPAGNFNCEFYFSVNSNAHNSYVYAELYKYDGTTFTLLGSNQAIPEYLSNGTTLSAYYFAIPVATSVLTITDRIAVRIFVNVDGRTVTLHTENNHLCQVVTTFSKGLTTLNSLTRQVQFFQTGTSGTDFAISSSVATHTFNLPVASAANTGKLSSTDWSTFNGKVPYTGATANVDLGVNSLFAYDLYANGNGTNNANLYLKQGTSSLLIVNGYSNILATGTKIGFQVATSAIAAYYADLQFSSLTAQRTYTLPDATGTLALLESTQTFTGINTFNLSPKNETGIQLKNDIGIVPVVTGYTNLNGLSAGLAITNSAGVSNNLLVPSTTGYSYTFPSASGTIALTSSLSGYVPYTGATGAVDLGAFDLTVNGVKVGKGTGGTNNTRVGASSFISNTTGFNNTSIGAINLQANTTGYDNTAIGNSALYTNTTGNINTALGSYALSNNISGTVNTAIGYAAGSYITTGSKNTIIGSYVGTPTMSNNIVLADGDGNIRYQWDGTSNNFDGILKSSGALWVNTSAGSPNSMIILAQVAGTQPPTLGNSSIGVNTTDFRFTATTTSTNFKSFSFSTSSLTNNSVRTYSMPDASGTLALTSDIPSGTITGTGTTNYHAKFTGTSTIGNSLIFDNGTNVGIGNTNTSFTFDVTGNSRFTTGSKIATASGQLLVGSNTSTIGTALEVVGDIYASNKIYGVNGTAANPSIRFFAGASGLYSTTGDDLGISTNGVSRMTITSAGDILFGFGKYFQWAADTSSSATRSWAIRNNETANGDFAIVSSSTNNNTLNTIRLVITNDGTMLVGGASSSGAYNLSLGNATANTYYQVRSTNTNSLYGADSRGTWMGNLSSKETYVNGSNLNPASDNSLTLGTSSYRWSVVYAVNGSIQTSDEREKTDIFTSDLGLDFINKLNPVSYKWKVGGNDVEYSSVEDENGKLTPLSKATPKKGIRNHYGLIAQQVKEVLGDKDFGGFVHDKETDMMSLRYDQFISPLIKAIQELSAKNEELSNRLIKLESK